MEKAGRRQAAGLFHLYAWVITWYEKSLNVKKHVLSGRILEKIGKIGWGWRIRTSARGVRVRCPTARLTPSAIEIISL